MRGCLEASHIGVLQNKLSCFFFLGLGLGLPDFFSENIPWVLNFPSCRGPGGSIPTGNVASLVSSNCPLWEERRGNTTRLPWVATRKPEEGILEVESYWEFVLS